jgi:hypothetical protein
MKRIIFAKTLALTLALVLLTLAACSTSTPSVQDSGSSSPAATDKQESKPQPTATPGVSLDEAKKKSGLYIKDGDKFVLVKPQWEYGYDGGYISTYPIRSDVASDIRGIENGSTSASVLLPVLFDANFEVPKIPNDAQFVIIGITDVAIYEVFDSGWTIPVGLSLWDDTIRNPGGWWSSPVSELIDYKAGSGMVSRVNQKFDEINGAAPTNYVSRMIYTGYQYNLASTHGIISASQNEQFTFSWMAGTDWTEETYTADKIFYALPVGDRNGVRADYEVVETRDGYFDVVFSTPPVGQYCIGPQKGSFESVVEFMTP